MAKTPFFARGAGTRSAFLDEAKRFVAGRAGEWIIRLIPGDWVTSMADKLPESLLTDGDTRESWSTGIGLVLDKLTGLQPGHRSAFQSFLEQTAEEIGKRKDKLDGKGGDQDRTVIREAMKASEGKLDPLREKTDQGDKVQKKVLPDYFTAKAAIKEDKIRATLSEIEQSLPEEDFAEFMRRGAYKIQTTPEELIDIAKTSMGDHEYGIMRLKSLVDGRRSEGSLKEKVKTIAENLLQDMVKGDGEKKGSVRFDEAVNETRAKIQAAVRKLRSFD